MRPYFEYPLMRHFMQRCLQHWVHRVRWAQIGFLLGMCVLLGACGGGTSNRDILKAEAAVAAAEAAKVPVSLYTTAPGSLTFPSGAAAAIYTIGGGVPPYAAGSSNAAVATVTVSQSNLNIAVGAVGSADVWILDSVGTKVELTVVVGFTTPSARLRTTAPDKLTLGVGGSGSFAISGGTPPYQTSSSNTSIVLPAVNGSTLLLVSGAGSGAAQVLVTDATGTQLVLEVSVGSATTPVLYTSAPSTLNMATASVARFTIGGGVPPYAVSSSDAGVATASATGNSLSLASIAAGKATILAIDSVGSSVRFEVSVGGALRTNAPEKISLGAGNVGIYTVSGGVPPYTASSGAPGIVTATVNGTNLTLAGGLNAGADVPVVVTDAAGTQLPALLVTVTASTTTAPSSTLRVSAPEKITLSAGSAGIYTIFGGTPPYIASSGAPGTVTAAVNGATLTLTGGASAGDAQVLVSDAIGTQVPITVTVRAAALYTSAPSEITIASGATPTPGYLVSGGAKPYSVTSSNTSVATVLFSDKDNTFSIKGVSVGDATIEVMDSGASTRISIKVHVSSSPGAALSVMPSGATGNVGDTLTFTLLGGSPSYSLSVSNTSIASFAGLPTTTVATNGGTFTASLLKVGTATVTVRDSLGQTLSFDITVNASPTASLYTSAPSEITIASGATTPEYSVSGDAKSYFVTSSNTSVAKVNFLSNPFRFSIEGKSVGDATIEVMDSGASTRISIKVHVSSSPGAALSVMPSGATGNVGDTLTFTLLGGSDYTLSVSNASIASLSDTTVTASGGTFTAALLNVGTVTVTVRDSRGQALSFDITVSSQLRLSPSAFVVGENETADIKLNIYGGSGIYTMAFSSDTVKASVLTVPATVPPSVAISGNTLTTSVGSSGNRCINPVTADVPPVYITSGTYDVTFTVLDSLGASATSVMTIKDNGAGLNLGCPP